jgi:hypothetical protein
MKKVKITKLSNGGELEEYPNGNKFWVLNGNYHRVDGPAIIHYNGSRFWYLNGEYHREDGPAVEYADATKCWYLNGKLHREDGPAVEWSIDNKFWYLNNVRIPCKTQEEFERLMKLKAFW